LGSAAHHWHGNILHFAPDRLLRGQRKELAALEGAFPNCLLAVACGRWDATHCLGFAAASPGKAEYASEKLYEDELNEFDRKRIHLARRF
jgi:hypothetical protein